MATGVLVWNEHLDDSGMHCPFSGEQVHTEPEDGCAQRCRASQALLPDGEVWP